MDKYGRKFRITHIERHGVGQLLSDTGAYVRLYGRYSWNLGFTRYCSCWSSGWAVVFVDRKIEKITRTLALEILLCLFIVGYIVDRIIKNRYDSRGSGLVDIGKSGK